MKKLAMNNEAYPSSLITDFLKVAFWYCFFIVLFIAGIAGIIWLATIYS